MSALCALPLFGMLFGSGSGSTSGGDAVYGSFEAISSTTAVIKGEDGITSNSLVDFNDLMADYPDINLIILEECSGSDDDETNLELSLKIHQLGISTKLTGESEIASGCVDLFLAGNTRTMEGGLAMIGVHAWATGDGQSATDFPNDSTEHDPYIQYYQDVGFTQQEAEEFYFFTINAAPANDVHWMSEAEIDQYGILTN